MEHAAPGVYVRHVETSSISPARTDIAGFIGIAERGPLFERVKVQSWTDFTTKFGTYVDQGFLAYAIDGFFANGGRTCHVVRVAGPSASPASGTIPDDLGFPALTFTAITPGEWGRRILVRVTHVGGDRFSLSIDAPGSATEFWPNLTMDTVHCVINDSVNGSRLVRVVSVAGAPLPPCPPDPAAGGRTTLKDLPKQGGFRLSVGGEDGLSDIKAGDFDRAIDKLDETDEIAILAIPDLIALPDTRKWLDRPSQGSCADLMPPAPAVKLETPAMPAQRPQLLPEEVNWLQNRLINQCELRKDRVALLDPVDPALTPAQAKDLRQKFSPTTYAALYYPWLLAPDLRPGLPPGAVRAVPPCGHVAGIYARVEWNDSVAKPPANEVIERAQGVTVDVDDVTHGYLNENQVDVLRVYPGRGLRVAGARLLYDEFPWMFVNVRRLFLLMERSLLQNLAWVVWEPNSPGTWLEVERSVRNFVDSLFRQGMLDGETAEQAYRVTCDATTNPPEQVDQGQLACVIAVLPPGCIEQVIVTLIRTDTGAALVHEERS